MAFYDYDAVRKAASGNWLFILERMAPQLSKAIEKVGRHVPCPVRGGTDGFRLFKDAHETGGGISNQDGPFHDGFALLMWLNGWTFQECVKEVAEQLGVEPEKRSNNTTQQASEKRDVSVQDLKNAKTYFGTLKDFGTAPFHDDPKNEKSYYATLVFQSGVVRTFWGVDLERAIAESEAQRGEHVTLANLGRVPVTLTVDKRDKTGVVVGQTEIQTFRNTWSVIRPRVMRAQTQAQAQVEARAEQEAEIVAGQVAGLARVSGSDIARTAQHPARTPEAQAATEARATAKVVPLTKGQTKQWLIEAQERAKANLERERQLRAQAAEKVMKVWDECVPFPSEHAEPMRRYFLSRQILFRIPGAEVQDSLRFHPQLPYYNEDGKLEGKFPAIVCAIRDVDGELVTLHRTYLTPSGKKAPVESSRKMMSIPEGMNVVGCAIQLGIPDGVMGVAEGLETALSAYKATQIPTWSTVSARLMESIEVPEGVHTVLIWADKDKSITGEKSARILKNRLQEMGIKAHILMPLMPRGGSAKSVDWNDVLCRQGLLGFPSVRHFL